MTRVTLIALPGALGSTLSIPLEMLTAAQDVARARRLPHTDLSLSVVSRGGQQVELMGGLTIEADRSLEDAEPSDLIFVPGFWGNPRAALHRNRDVVDWLRRNETATFCALTTGAYFLAEAGLLDGIDATTHWRFFNDFSQRYPQVTLQRRRFITRARNCYCTGSVDAVRDVMLHLVDTLFGHATAAEIARQFTHEPSPSLESSFLADLPEESHHDEVVISVQSWMHAHFAEEFDLQRLADAAGISSRSVSRRFKLATGTTPLAYLRSIRLGEAKSLLRDSNASVLEVCGFVGFRDTSHFIALFRRETGATPGEYRKLVRAKMFSARNAGE